MSWQIAVLGLGIGMSVGASGVGAGVLTAPILILLGVHPTIAVGTDLVYSGVTKLVGTARNAALHLVDPRWLAWMVGGGVPGAVAGTLATGLLGHDAGRVVRVALGIVLIVAAVAIVFKDGLARRGWVARGDLVARRPSWVAAAGAAIGFLVGLTSVGSGSLFMILLMVCSSLSAERAVATDIATGAAVTVGAGLLHLAAGTVNLPLAANLLAGSIPGILLGGRLAGRVPVVPLRYGVAVLVLLGGIRTL